MSNRWAMRRSYSVGPSGCSVPSSGSSAMSRNSSFSPEHREDAVRGQVGEGLGELEVVGELRALLVLAVADAGDEPAARPHALAQVADQVGVLGEALDQDRPRAVERGLRVGHALVGVDVARRGLARVVRGVREQQVGQRLQPGLDRDLGLGPALGLEGQVDVLEPGLGVGGHDAGFQRVVELVLGADRLQHRGAPLLQLPQVAQPVFQGAQLGVVEGAGRLLAVAGDERHGRPAVEEVDCRLHLPLADAELLGDLVVNRCRHDPDPPYPSYAEDPPCILPEAAGGPARHSRRRVGSRLPSTFARGEGEVTERRRCSRQPRAAVADCAAGSSR